MGDGDKGRNFIFQRRSEEPKIYIKRGNDKILDIDDPVDMEDYFFKLDKDDQDLEMSPEMKEYMERRKVNQEFIQKHVVDRAKTKLIEDNTKKAKLKETKQNNQIKVSITLIQAIILIAFAVAIKDLIINDIDSFYDMLYARYLEFSGKSV